MKIKCVICGALTEFEEGTPLEMRESSYIETIGQLCGPCNARVCEESERMERVMAAAEAKKYNLVPLDPCKPLERVGCPDCFQLMPAIGILLDFTVFKCGPCGKLFRKEDAI